MKIFLTMLALTLPALAAPEQINGNAEIRGKAGGSEIVIKTSDRTAGAICSLTWNGKEFIDAADHGRELQSASNFDMDGDIKAETFNPTEAGSCRDGAGQKTTSKLLFLHADGNELVTTNQMAFWLVPGQKSSGIPARNTKPLSDHLLAKRVRIGIPNFPNVIDYQVTFTLPAGERHTHGVFEALTGYMPAEFSAFWRFDLKTRKLETLDKDPGEIPSPVILATQDSRYAMGIYAPPVAGAPKTTYGRFDFPHAKVTKWNCVYRVTNRAGLPAGGYSNHMFVIVGTLDDVRATLDAESRTN
ncbi:MAG: hypothetical protein NTY53_07515 [Kiritimatiellaeota bacterium]|nr:hypothetical protein [Kiritimatiellota bacterium]